jgi:membrane protein YdbS with pleckstrin-like domain
MTPPNSPAPPNTTNNAWIPWLLVMFLFSLLIAVCAGFLTFLTGTTPPHALLAGGAAFGGAALLCTAVVPAVQQLRRRH